jgi:ubiquinone/menaquinone biosynthesis C-methylase UbiE
MVGSKADDVLAAWETSSQYWNKHQALIETMFAPLTRALIDHARIVPGQSVLDVGGGSGEPSLTIALLVGPTGSVTYTDPAAGMVKAARSESRKRKLTNIKFHQAPAQELPFSDDSFDVVVSRLAVMFFPDVLAGLRELLRSVKPGGTISLLVWAPREVNPFFTVITDLLNQFVSAEPEAEDAPTAFRFATSGKLASLLREAGATDVTETPVPFRIEAPIDIERFWELRTEMSDTFRSKLAQLSTEQVSAARDAIKKAVAEYFENGSMSFPAQALVVSGRKSF